MNDPLRQLLDSMTPAERNQFDTIQAATAAGLLTNAERASIAQRPTVPGWAAFVDDLRLRLAANSRLTSKPQ